MNFSETMLRRIFCGLSCQNLHRLTSSRILYELFPSVSNEIRYFYIGRGGALRHILRKWVHSGLEETPQEMADVWFCSVFR